MIRESIGRKIFNWLNVTFMLLLMVATAYPLLYVLFASVSDPEQMMAFSGFLWRPLGFSSASYKMALSHPLLVSGYLNTIYLVVLGTSINIIMTAIGAYFLSRKDVWFQRPIALMIIFTMFFSGGLIPFYLTVRGLPIFDTTWALIIPYAIGTFNMLILRTGFKAIPDSIEESATIDGAGHFIILFKFVLPLALPTVVVIILYYAVGHWNSWFPASIFIRDPAKFPLQLVLRQILIVGTTENLSSGVDIGAQKAISETIKYSTIVIATLPILCVYPFLQRYFVKGVMVGSVKG